MREIKFRAWDKNEKVWISGKQPDSDDLFVGGEGPYFIDMWHRVIAMQYTGLKDKNGKEIYEGDICKFIKTGFNEYENGFGQMDDIAVIEWDEVYAAFTHRNVMEWHLRENRDSEGMLVDWTFEISIGFYVEIIGNIHENPEMVGEGGNYEGE